MPDPEQSHLSSRESVAIRRGSRQTKAFLYPKPIFHQQSKDRPLQSDPGSRLLSISDDLLLLRYIPLL